MPREYKGHTVHEDGRVYLNPRVTTRRDGVKRKMRGRWLKSRVRKAGKGNGGGYVYIDLSVENTEGHLIVEHWLVHRLVATLFIDKPQGTFEVNHRDGNRANNNVSNLEWVTHSENQKHAYATGVRSDVGEHNARAKLTNDQAKKVWFMRNIEGKTLTTIASMFGISFQSVSRIAKGGHHAVK